MSKLFHARSKPILKNSGLRQAGPSLTVTNRVLLVPNVRALIVKLKRVQACHSSQETGTSPSASHSGTLSGMWRTFDAAKQHTIRCLYKRGDPELRIEQKSLSCLEQ